jgi:hypothetical protein
VRDVIRFGLRAVSFMKLPEQYGPRDKVVGTGPCSPLDFERTPARGP